MLHEQGKHFTHIAALVAAGVKLAVAESAGATLAKTIVGIGIYRAGAAERSYVEASLVDATSPLEHHRAHAKLQRPESGEKTGRPGTHYYHSGRCRRHVAKLHGLIVARHLHVGAGCHAQRDIDHDLTLAGVDRPSHDAEIIYGITPQRGMRRQQRGKRLPVGRDFGPYPQCDILNHYVSKLFFLSANAADLGADHNIKLQN